MAEFAKAPNSCEVNKLLNRGWSAQVKPVGADPSEYRYVRGLTSVGVAIETQTVDSSDLDSDGWNSQEKTSRTLTINLAGQFAQKGTLPVLDESQELLRVTGQEIGADGKVDVRVWRQDIDEGWETTAVNSWTEESGDANALRTFSAALQSVCAPVRIHSVKEGADKTESVPVDDKERLAIIRPRGAAGTTETVGGDTEAADGGPEAA